MKWGVRKDGGKAGSKKGERKAARANKKAAAESRRSSDSTTARKLAKKSLGELSNDELQMLNTRLNLEQNYSRLTDKPGKIKRGANIANGVLSVAKKGNEIYGVFTSPAAKQVAKLVKKKLNE